MPEPPTAENAAEPLREPRGLIGRIYPFSTLPNPKPVWAWGMYDLANQSFALLILTLFFPLYFKNVVVGTPERGDALWSMIYALSLCATAVISPVLGAIGDCRRSKKALLIWSGVLCCVLTAGLALAGAGDWILAAALFIPANIAFNVGQNFMSSYLPSLSTPRTIGRVSAIGWTMGFVGAMLLLVLSLAMMFAFGWKDPTMWTPFFVFAAVWYGLNMVPTALILGEPEGKAMPGDEAWIAVAAVHRLGRTVAHAARFKQLFRFLLAFLVSSFGVQVMVTFASILAQDFGIGETGLVAFVGQLSITAMIMAAVTARYQDRIGSKATVLIFNGVWLVSCAALLAVTLIVPVDPPQWIFWVIGNGIGIGLGGIGTASRAMVGKFSPTARTAEFFGLSGLAYTLAGAIGVASFGAVKAGVGAWWAGHMAFGNANTPALALLALFFVVGLALTLRVNETAGLRAAMREDRDHTGKPADRAIVS